VKLKAVRFEENIFNTKFSKLIKEYDYVKEHIKDNSQRIKEISEDE